MIVYHVSYCIVDKPDIKFSREALDFGKGFYVTNIKIQAQNWTKKFKLRGQKAYINIYELPKDHIKESYRVKEFLYYDNEWLDFIIACRSGIPHDFDIVIGAMADDQIYNYISDYMEGTITREQFWVMAKFKYPTHQINFCTQEALKCLQYRGYEEVK